MNRNGPHLTIEIRSPRAQETDKVSGKEIQTLFSRAEYLVHQACKEPVRWMLSNGTQHELNLHRIVRADHEPTPTSVRVHLSVPVNLLAHAVRPEAEKALVLVKSRWSNRLRIWAAGLMGMDLERADKENLERIQEQMHAMLWGWVLHNLGFRLAAILSEEGEVDPSATFPNLPGAPSAS